MNRPIADIAVRQLILAKAVDSLQVKLGHQALFPFVVQPVISSGTTQQDVPVSLIWDFHASMPKKWEQLRLAKIKRISGTNSTSGYSGKLRLVFTANVENSSTETAIFYADYQIDSSLTFQPSRLQVVTSVEEAVYINPGEVETVSGFILFKTMDMNEANVQAFLDLVAPGEDSTDSDSNGYYDNPAVYDIVDSVTGGTAVTEDFSISSLSHGTGLLTDSAFNTIPQLDSDIQSWLSSFNYPFDASANRTSADSITIPSGLFREFNITAPAGDSPTGDISGTTYPVWISRIMRNDLTSDSLIIYFATYNITDSDIGGSPSTTTVEFATLNLPRGGIEGQILAISPITDGELLLKANDGFDQHFGRGHVVLSSLWDKTTTEIDDFFDAFLNIIVTPSDTEYNQATTRISSFGISRVPKYTPTKGQSRALAGSTARLDSPIFPSDTNRYICEQDQGLGNMIDFQTEPVTSHAAIDRYGYTGSLAHRSVKLVVDSTKTGSDPAFYDTQILPRLRILFGRDPQFGDEWFNGTRFMKHNGDTWQG